MHIRLIRAHAELRERTLRGQERSRSAGRPREKVRWLGRRYERGEGAHAERVCRCPGMRQRGLGGRVVRLGLEEEGSSADARECKGLGDDDGAREEGGAKASECHGWEDDTRGEEGGGAECKAVGLPLPVRGLGKASERQGLGQLVPCTLQVSQ